MNNLITLTIAS